MMLSDTKRSPAEIEREIERQRAELGANLSILQEKFSLEGIVQEIGSQVREHGNDIGTSMSRALKDNPIPAALMAVSLGWMMFGGRTNGRAFVPANDAGEHRTTTTSSHSAPPSEVFRSQHQRQTPSWATYDDQVDGPEAASDWR